MQYHASQPGKAAECAILINVHYIDLIKSSYTWTDQVLYQLPWPWNSVRASSDLKKVVLIVIVNTQRQRNLVKQLF